MTRLEEAMQAVWGVFGYAVHPDDKQTCLDELEEVLAPFVPQPDEPELDNPYGLEEGDVVRFPRPGKVRPDTGKIIGRNSNDGSFRVMNDRTKMERALLPEQMERQVLGQRGGERWEPVVK